MHKYTILLAAIILFICSCGDSSQKQQDADSAQATQWKKDSAGLAAALNEIDVPSQIFSAPGNEISFVRGEKGTVIFLSPGDLETEDGQAPGNKVIVELKELTTQAELAMANAQTMSNSNLLVSGGAYYINIVSDGKQLRLKNGKALKVSFPKITNDDMKLYSGERITQGQMNWQPTNTPLTSKEGYRRTDTDTVSDISIMVYNPKSFDLMGYVGNDSTYKRDTGLLNAIKKKTKDSITTARIYAYFKKRYEDSVSWVKNKPYVEAATKLERALYDIVNVNKLGWVNIDQFEKSQGVTDITYVIDPQDSIKLANVYLIYYDINAVVTHIYRNDEPAETRNFNDAPVGYRARLLAVTMKNDELLTCKLDLTIVNHQHTVIKWKKTSKETFRNYFDVNYEWGQ